MSKKADEPETRPEYDFDGGVRGKYVERLEAGSRVVVLDPDVAEKFASSEEVNRVLRAWLARKESDEGAA